MPILSVIIPYYQREPRILARALHSVKAQHVPEGWTIEVIVVDDGSPIPAQRDLAGLEFPAPFYLKLIQQPNGGASVARNRGLDEVAPQSELIAFLDSDDIWPDRHLSDAIEAVGMGFDFVFSDHKRVSLSDSHLNIWAHDTNKAIQESCKQDGFVEIPSVDLPKYIILEFPTSASVVVYKRSIASEVRYNHNLFFAGEDVLFMTQVASKAKRVCFNAREVVQCGEGINLFFSQLDWSSSRNLSVRRDQVLAHTIIAGLSDLSEKSLSVNEKRVQHLRKVFAFHAIRRFVKDRFEIPKEVGELVQKDPGFWRWFPFAVLYVCVLYPIGRFKP